MSTGGRDPGREPIAKAVVMALTLIVFLWAAVTSSIQGRVLGVVLLALVVWSLFPRHHLVSSILIIGLLSLFEASLSPSEFIRSLFATYGTSGLWIIVSGFILSAGMEASGLAHRIALWTVTSLGGDPQKVVLSVALANLAIAPISPSTTAKSFMLLPICDGLIEAFGVEKGRSRYGAAIMIMAMAGNNISSTGFLTATIPNPISAEFIRQSAGVTLSWFDWLRMAFPLTLILLVASWVVCRWMFSPEVSRTPEAMERIMKLRRGRGPLSRGEILVAATFSVSLILWITERRLGINGGLISLALSLLLLAPRIGVLKIGGFAKATPWGSIALFAASMFIARAVERWRALEPVAEGVFRIFDFRLISLPAFVSLLTVVFMLLHIAFTSTTVYATLMTPLAISLAQLRGVQPQLIALPVAFMAPIALILPVNTIPNIIFYSSGFFNQRQMITYGIVVSLVSVAVVLFLGMPYWMLQGFI